jgi:hypothetical protein
MDMGMNFEFLTPSVQHAEETNLCTEVSRITRNFLKCFRAGAKQEIVEDLLVLQNQWRQTVGQCEDDVQVARRKEFSSTRRNPAFPSGDLTLRAMAISAVSTENVVAVKQPRNQQHPGRLSLAGSFREKGCNIVTWGGAFIARKLCWHGPAGL